MSNREKILGIATVGAVGVFAVWFGLRPVLTRPFENQKRAITHARSELARLETRRDAELVHVKRDWRLLTARTLAATPDDAQDRFREDISGLLAKHGFDQKQVTLKSDALPKKRAGIVEAGLQIATKGRLKEVVSLLIDLAQRDYLLKVETVTLNAERPGGGKSARPDPNGPELTVSIHCSTLVVPKLQNIAHEPASQIGSAKEGALPRPLDEYSRIAQRNVFAEYVPPPPRVDPPAQPTAVTQKGPETTDPVETAPPAPPDIRADAGHFRLTGTGSLRGNAVAFIRDDRVSEGPASETTLNAPLDDGVLLLVHPRGIVIRATQGGEAGRDFFYPVGATFTERVQLDPATHADVAGDLKIALRRE